MTLPKNDIEKVSKFIRHMYRKYDDKQRLKVMGIQILKNKGYKDEDLNKLIVEDKTDWREIFLLEEIRLFMVRFLDVNCNKCL